jgi:CelD/BcsL family acetyltransferase involved in cellulose biosynthesis
MLGPELESRGWRLVRVGVNVCPFIDIGEHSWDSYLDSLGPKHRYNFRRRLRRLKAEHEIRFERVASEAERRPALESLIRLHDERWRRRGGSTAFHRPDLIAFHDEFSAIALDRGWLRLYSLVLDGSPAALLYGFRYGGTFYFYQSAFDARFARESAGLVTMGLAIRAAIEEGATEYDLLHGDEVYKSSWAPDSRPLFRLALYPPTAGGAVSRRLVGIRHAAGKMVRRVL